MKKQRSLLQIFEQVVYRREIHSLVESAGDDTLRSFLSLAKSNDGKFKSEKQAAFLKSRTDGGSFSYTQVINFGTSSASRRQVNWDIQIDDVGVVKIVKNTASKGDVLYWERGNANTVAGARAAQRANNTELMRNDMIPIVDGWKEYVADKQAELARMKAAVDDPQFAGIRNRLVELIAKFEEDIADHQGRIDRAVAAHNL